MSTVSELVVSLGMNTTSFNQKISEVNSKIKLVQSEFKNASAGVEGFQKSSEGLATKCSNLSKKQELLTTKVSLYKNEIEKTKSTLSEQNKKLEDSKVKVNNLTKRYEESVKVLGENADETKKLKSELDSANNEFKNAEKQVLNTTNKLTKLETQLNNTESEFKDVSKEVTNLNKELKNEKLTNFSNKCKSASDKLTNIGSSIESAGKKLSVISGAIGGIGVISLKTTVEFDKQMATVKALSGATGDEFEKLKEKAVEMGKSTSFSSYQAGQGLEFMSLAGWSTEEMLVGLEPILRLAEASSLDLGLASDLVTDSLAGFGLGANDLAGYLDIVAKTSTSTNTTTDSLMEAFMNCSSNATRLGLSVEETSGILGIFANTGLKGSNAGTKLNSILTRMTAQTKVAKSGWSMLGVEVFNADGSMRDFTTICKEVSKSLSKMSEEEQTVALKAIVGTDNITAFTNICNAAADDSLPELITQLKNSEGALDEMGAVMQDTTSYRIESMKSALSESARQIGEELVPHLEKAVKWITETANWFSNLDENTQGAIIKMGLFIGALGPVMIVVGNLCKALGGITGAVGKLAGKFASSEGSVKGFSAILGNLSGFALPALSVALLGVMAYIGDNENALLKLQEKWGSLGTVISGICEFISGVVQLTFGDMVSWVQLGIDCIAATIDGPGGKTIEDAWNNHNERINKNAEEVYSKLTLTSTRGMSQLLTLTNDELSQLVNVFDTMTGEVDNIVEGNYSSATKTLATQLEGMSSSQLSALTGLNDQTEVLFKGIKESMSLDEVEERLKLNFEDMKNAGLTNAQDLNTNISGALETLSSKMDSESKTGANSVKENLSQATSTIKEETNSMSSNAASGMEEVANSFMNSSGKIPKDVQSNMDKSVQAVKQAGSDMYNGVRTSFSKLETVSKQHMTNLYKGVCTSMTKTDSNVRQSASNMYNGSKTSFVNIANVGLNQFSRLYNGATNSMKSLSKNVSSYWSNIRNTLNQSVQGKISVTKSYNYETSNDKQKSINDQTYSSRAIEPISVLESVSNYSRSAISTLGNDLNLNKYRTSGDIYLPQNISKVNKSSSENLNSGTNSTLQAIIQQNQLLINLLNKDREMITYVNLDGKQVAKASAKYMEIELNTLNNRKNRLGGR